MLNDIKPPPIENNGTSPAPAPRPVVYREVPPSPHGTGRDSTPAPTNGDGVIHTEPDDLGRHHTRIAGERTRTDLVYATPLEDRGSNFNLAMSIITVSIFVLLVLVVWFTLGFD